LKVIPGTVTPFREELQGLAGYGLRNRSIEALVAPVVLGSPIITEEPGGCDFGLALELMPTIRKGPAQ
jgi:hypothetical protein